MPSQHLDFNEERTDGGELRWQRHAVLVVAVVGATWVIADAIGDVRVEVGRAVALIERNAEAIERNAKALDRAAALIDWRGFRGSTTNMSASTAGWQRVRSKSLARSKPH